jgi:DNA-directed RNA polymerase subunit RPC12/RpoP
MINSPKLIHGAHGWFAEIKVGNCPNFEPVAAMPALPQRTLKVVPAPLIESIPTAPPVLEMPNPTVEYKCGNCSAVLMHVDESKTYPLIVHCVSCGSYNSTEA